MTMPEAAFNGEKGRFDAHKNRSRLIQAFFTWQNGCDYRQCLLIKLPVFWQK
jgi:hypothetical protein